MKIRLTKEWQKALVPENYITDIEENFNVVFETDDQGKTFSSMKGQNLKETTLAMELYYALYSAMKPLEKMLDKNELKHFEKRVKQAFPNFRFISELDRLRIIWRIWVNWHSLLFWKKSEEENLHDVILINEYDPTIELSEVEAYKKAAIIYIMLIRNTMIERLPANKTVWFVSHPETIELLLSKKKKIEDFFAFSFCSHIEFISKATKNKAPYLRVIFMTTNVTGAPQAIVVRLIQLKDKISLRDFLNERKIENGWRVANLSDQLLNAHLPNCTFEKVVLDGLNLSSVDMDSVNFSKLLEAVEYLRDCGLKREDVTVVLPQSLLTGNKMGRKISNVEAITEIWKIADLVGSGRSSLQEGDDIVAIEYAMLNNALVVSTDFYKNHRHKDLKVAEYLRNRRVATVERAVCIKKCYCSPI
eukprot:GHVP01069118.1.p1 GENE.GHVP01069118.1~~GHVP01069118.1.p1  ORF type:complete len:418 (-),score=85.17 GHVP01069118.1:382-1635(-)